MKLALQKLDSMSLVRMCSPDMLGGVHVGVFVGHGRIC